MSVTVAADNDFIVPGSFHVNYGFANNMLRKTSVDFTWDLPLYPGDRVTTHLAASVDHWKLDQIFTDSSYFYGFHIAPVLMYHLVSSSDYFSPYMFISSGYSYFSEKEFSSHILSTRSQLQTDIGFGYSFGSRHEFDMALFLTNYTNFNSNSSSVNIIPSIRLGYYF